MTPEQKIREQRLVEATQKNYIGINTGKFGCILNFLGEPVMANQSSLYESTDFESPYDYNLEENEIPVFDEEEATSEVGRIFDGLSRGMHLEIQYLDGILSVYYKGILVYLEDSGELETYFPHPEWEDKIEQLYQVAANIQKIKRQETKLENKERKEELKENWLKHMWKQWGFKVD